MGGHKRIRYALIGLAAYVFHYDQSKSLNHLRLWQYLIALGDLHNFHMSVEVCKKFFREEYLSTKIPLEPFNVNNPYLAKPPMSFMTPQSRLEVRNSAELWTEKNYPETRDENVKILDEYLTLCEDNNIRPIMFLPPSTEGYKKHFGKKKLDEFYYLVRQACRKHSSAIFIDGWKLQGVTDADFYDYGHMNIQGAAKFSSFLNDFIERLDG